MFNRELSPPGKFLVHAYCAANESYSHWEGMDRKSQAYKDLKVWVASLHRLVDCQRGHTLVLLQAIGLLCLPGSGVVPSTPTPSSLCSHFWVLSTPPPFSPRSAAAAPMTVHAGALHSKQVHLHLLIETGER